MGTRLAILAVAAPLLAGVPGCGTGGGGGDPDASSPDAESAMPVVPGGECPETEGEDCLGCYENVGRCCYDDDPDWNAAIAALAAACSSRPACAACCDECAAMSCDELLEADACPASE